MQKRKGCFFFDSHIEQEVTTSDSFNDDHSAALTAGLSPTFNYKNYSILDLAVIGRAFKFKETLTKSPVSGRFFVDSHLKNTRSVFNFNAVDLQKLEAYYIAAAQTEVP